MIAKNQKLFERFARLDTWVVGLQYYDDAGEVEDEDVVFERDPKNPFDENAIAVFTTSGVQIGHLPQYDAIYLSPLILQGVVGLKGHVGVSSRGDIAPLALEIFATSKVSEILMRDTGNDWRAIYHNLFIDIWERLSEYSSVTLHEFRERFRPLAHEEPFFPKTQFLYRMLKAHIADLKKQEAEYLRDKIIASVKKIEFGSLMGWPELTVIPLDEDGAVLSTESVPNDAEEIRAIVGRDNRLEEVLRLLPSHCPYPAGARGAVVLIYGEFDSIDWLDSAAAAEVYWYQMILSGINNALNEGICEIAVATVSDNVKANLLENLLNAEYILDTEQDDTVRIEISVDDGFGYGRYRGDELVRLNFKRECILNDEVTQYPMQEVE